MKAFTIITFCFLSFNLLATPFPIPNDKEVSFDVLRKNKLIGSLNTKFIDDGDQLIIHSILKIDVKILFFPAYKFFQETKETWINDNFVSIEGFTDFEDDREYKINGIEKDEFFLAYGMDGELKLDKDIVSLNYWNISMLKEKEVFDTQKGIVRKIDVKEKNEEKIEVNKKKVIAKKYIFNASKHIKDKGPFPEYSLWYHNDELLQMHFLNPKDKKLIKIIRNDWGN